jgi:hypothetical protein
MFLAIGVAVGVCVGLVIGVVAVPLQTSTTGTSGTTGPTGNGTVPSVSPVTSSCFGGGVCNGTGPSGNGSGTNCVVSGFAETAGDFLFVAINYAAGTNEITSVTDGGGDSFIFVAGAFGFNQSVAFFDVPVEHGGTVAIDVAIARAAFGGCTVGQLSAGTRVGAVGTGASVPSDMSLSVTNPAQHSPSLLMALFGATRPTGDPFVTITPVRSSAWWVGGLWTGYTYLGTAQVLVGVNDTAVGQVTFTWQVGNTQTPSISGVAVEFYLGS